MKSFVYISLYPIFCGRKVQNTSAPNSLTRYLLSPWCVRWLEFCCSQMDEISHAISFCHSFLGSHGWGWDDVVQYELPKVLVFYFLWSYAHGLFKLSPFLVNSSGLRSAPLVNGETSLCVKKISQFRSLYLSGVFLRSIGDQFPLLCQNIFSNLWFREQELSLFGYSWEEW